VSTPQVDDWDTIAPTTQRAVVAKVLRERDPIRTLTEVMSDAGAIIDALRGHGSHGQTEPAEEYGLTALQQIRIEVFHGLLGDAGWPVDPVAFFGDFATAAAPFVEWIRTGAEPSPERHSVPCTCDVDETRCMATL